MPVRARSNLPVVVAAATAVVLIAPGRVLFPECGSPGPWASKPVVLRVLTASQKAPLVDDVFELFEKTRPHIDGRCIEISRGDKPSGEAAKALIRGWSDGDGKSATARGASGAQAGAPAEPWFPDVWYPSASPWVEQVHHWRPDLVPEGPGPSVATTAHVIAMPRSMAKALGWPERNIGWRDLFDLARDPRGWENKGHPEWGSFWLGKTNPNHSTSGLYATVGAYFAAKQTTDLRHEDVSLDDVRNFVRAVEASVLYYAETSRQYLESLRKADGEGKALQFVSAIALQETSVLEYNLGNSTGEVGGVREQPPQEPLAAIYPREGVLFADQPYVVLRAPWVSEQRQAAAGVLFDFLRSERAQKKFLAAGFRLTDDRVGPAINVNNGLLPAVPAPLDPPPRHVVEKVQAEWPAVRKRARALIVLDTSAVTDPAVRDADPNPLPYVVPALRNALKRFSDDDEVGLWAYSPNTGAGPPQVELVPLGRLAENRPLLDAKIQSLRPAGPSRLAATLTRAVQHLGRSDASKINEILVLTHGRDAPGPEVTEGLNTLTMTLNEPARAGRIRVFPIAYGPHADCDTAQRIAQAARTEPACVDDPSRIGEAVDKAVSNF